MVDDVTAVDCYELWEAGTQFIPELSDIYGKIASSIGALGDEEYRFNQKVSRSTGSGHESNPDGWQNFNETSPVYPHFTALRDEIQRMLSTTVTNLNDTGTALNMAAWAYSERDELTEDMISKITGNYDIPEESLEAPTEPGDS